MWCTIECWIEDTCSHFNVSLCIKLTKSTVIHDLFNFFLIYWISQGIEDMINKRKCI